jgi:AmmeMemoRadiSam system protein A
LFNLPAQSLESAAECGLRSLQILIGFLDTSPVFGTCLSYEGPFGVGYAVCVFRENADQDISATPSLLPLIKEEHVIVNQESVLSTHPYVQLARQSLTHYLHAGTQLQRPDSLSDELFNFRKACFVSIKKNENLRGCIGTLQPNKASLAHEIISNALSAGLHDPRFSPVTLEELPGLRFSVDVLSAAESATRAMLDPKIYGVIVRLGNRSGVLLPDLEGVDTVDRQLAITLQKAGIRAEEPYSIERFTVDRYAEHSP